MRLPGLTLELRVVVSVVVILTVSMTALVSLVVSRSGATARADAPAYAERLSDNAAGEAQVAQDAAARLSGLAEDLRRLVGGFRV